MFKPKRVTLKPDTAAKWKQVYFRMKNADKDGKGKSFNQAIGYFCRLHKYRPPRNLPLMPRDIYDWYRPIRLVRFDRLIKDPNYVPGARSSTRKKKVEQKGLFDGTEAAS
jgi:hypothetical protein